jgi:hypothetical protein
VIGCGDNILDRAATGLVQARKLGLVPANDMRRRAVREGHATRLGPVDAPGAVPAAVAGQQLEHLGLVLAQGGQNLDRHRLRSADELQLARINPQPDAGLLRQRESSATRTCQWRLIRRAGKKPLAAARHSWL